MAPRRILNAWGGPRARRWTRGLVIIGTAALPLQSTATLDLGYTARASYVLFALALTLGFPFALQGWRRNRRWFGLIAIALLWTYALATVFGDVATIAGTARGGRSRAFLYLVDIVLGLGVVGLLAGLWTSLDELRPLLIAAVVGATIAALYGVYQWFALHFGWPFSDILTTRDSNGVTTGVEQGPGLFGWERARGTFLEPHFLGAFMAGAAPLALLLGASVGGRPRRIAHIAAALMVAAILLTSSAPAWAGLGLAALGAGAAWAVASGRPRLATPAAMAAIAAILCAPLLLFFPETLARATGREAQSLIATAEFRTQAWDTALHIWEARPVAGYGAGQSSIQLSLVQQGDRAVGLNSAQGLWAAALVDAGVPGLGVWLLLLGGTTALSLQALFARPSLATAAVVASVLAGVVSTLVAGDRMDLRIWLLAGIATLAGSRRVGPSDFGGLAPGNSGRARTREPD